MKFSKIYASFFLATLVFTGLKCDPGTVVGTISTARSVIEISSSLIGLLNQFSDFSKNFKSEVSTLTAQTSQDIDNQNTAVSVAQNWQSQWAQIKTNYDNLNYSLQQIKDTSELFFQELWRTNHTINDDEKRLEDSTQNQKLEDKWLIEYNKASKNLENAHALIIVRGNDVEALLQNYAARGQLLNSIASLQSISNEAQELSQEIETFTLNVNSIFSLQRVEITNPQKSDTKILSSITNFTMNFDVFKEGQKGMEVHLKFNVTNMKDMNGKCVIYFYHDDGTKLIASNLDKYSTSDGQVSYGEDFKPGYDNTDYNDFTIFFPYEKLNLAAGGSYNLKVVAYIFDQSDLQNPKTLIVSDYHSFTINN